MNKLVAVSVVTVAVLVVVYVVLYIQLGIRPAIKTESSLNEIKLPEGFHIGVYAENLGSSGVMSPGPNAGARMMMVRGNVVYVSITNQGKIIALRDINLDGKSDSETVFIEGLDKPHGIDYRDGWFYIAEEKRIIRVRDDTGDNKVDTGSMEVLINDIPSGGHFTRTIKVYNSSLYFSMGSSCNVCNDDDPRRAAITKCDLYGNSCEIFANGLRNSVGFVFNGDQLYATDNGRDSLGDNIPPDEVNIIEQGRNYGWPVCYGNKIHDTDFDKNTYIRDPCEDTVAPLVELQAHSAPLGLAFYSGNKFPEDYQGDLFVAFHGSWNRQEPTGYKIVRIDFPSMQVIDFAFGWLQPGNVLGRPVDIVNFNNDILVSDDNAGKIYRIWYE